MKSRGGWCLKENLLHFKDLRSGQSSTLGQGEGKKFWFHQMRLELLMKNFQNLMTRGLRINFGANLCMSWELSIIT